MSNIYILEPPTSGKVLLKTTVGDIDIELWAKETPKTCRNFIQLCMEGYYDGTIFHRVVKDFIVQGGDPRGDGTGGESIYGEPFKDEFHQRLRFVRRGLLAMANADKDDNGSQFFFTLAPTQELQNKHTIFGKVTGETLYNMLKLGEGLVEDERPVYPHKIIKTEILHNPFLDIEPRQKEVKIVEKKTKVRTPGVKNFKLLSFGQEAEEDEEESTSASKKYSGKSKSTHDVLDDPKLSSETTRTEENTEEAEEPDPEEQLENIRKKLKTDHKKIPIKKSYLHEEELNEKEKKREEIKKEIENVKREYQKNKLKRDKEIKEDKEKEIKKNEMYLEYKNEHNKYKEMATFPKKGASREEFTLNLLSKFKQKLISAKEKDKEEEHDQNEVEVEEDKDKEEENWLTHELHFKDDAPILAKDANTKGDDWFEIYDPRNPLNKRRRGEASQNSSKN
ncbi:hypothetical protein ILUMI_26842 [Ignelater luminosus]|uniref:Spliceosome-associated protein CWC27 homolog n=1 Tax=Ignelater luminosus TaxID=2038154 RepID=A0A8K0FYA5_IGNLU|nr:hypothetical protein ILUMI_26842 [Ignelater luminosus]